MNDFSNTVERHRPKVRTEQRRVTQTEIGAVRESRVRDLWLSHRGADRVHVARGLVGIDERQLGPTPLRATVDERLRGRL